MGMRFSDMMGSGDDRTPKQPAPTDAETAIANALAPYLDTSAPIETEPWAPPAADPSPAAAPFVSAGVAPLAGAARTEPLPRIEPEPVAPVESTPTSIADFTPLSDDLLPHRR
jgi:hypothetical protein